MGDIIIHQGWRCKVKQRMKMQGQNYNYYNLQPERLSRQFKSEGEINVIGRLPPSSRL